LAVINPSPTEWTSQLRRGVLELCVLRILKNKTSYGYEIVATLEAWAPLATGENTVYPLLRRLKSDGQLETFMADSPAGPPRQYFRLTPQGRKRLQMLEKEWGELARAVEDCMNNGGAP
jgi:PadR family transcriptional regulator PadR